MREKSIWKINLFSIIIIFSIFTVVIILSSINSKYESFDTIKAKVENKYLDIKKEEIKRKVSNINSLIDTHTKKVENIVKDRIKERVYNAYEIIKNIYNKEKDKRTHKEILNEVKEVLRTLTFDNGRGYFYINTLEGKNILYPTYSQTEGKNIIDLKDGKGHYKVKEERDNVLKNKEAFTIGYWPNPILKDNKLHKKISFSKVFEPLGIYVGTGDYLDYMEKYLIKEVTSVLEDINKEVEKEYIFIFDENINIILHPRFEDSTYLRDIDKKVLIKARELLKKSSNVFVKYEYFYPNTTSLKDKISYFEKNERYNWIVASGFYLNDLAKEIDKSKVEIESIVKDELYKNIPIIIFFLVILLFLILMINRFTNRMVNEYKVLAENKSNELKVSEDYLKKYTKIIEKSNIVSKTDINGVITYVSDDYCKAVGFSREELIGKKHNITKHPDTDDKFFEDLWNTITNKKTFSAVIKDLTKDKKTIYLNTTISPILDLDGNVMEYIATRFDITEQRFLEKELKKQNQKLSKAQEIAKIGSYELNLLTDEVIWSDEHFKILGLKPQGFRPCRDDFYNYVFDEDKEYVKKAILQAIKEKKETTYRYRVKLNNGSTKYVQSTSLVTEYDEYGKAIILTGTILDITNIVNKEHELIEKEKMLVQQSKMATMGEMIANIAHQWKQPLGAISAASGSVKIAKELDILDDKDLVKALDSIGNSVQYLSQTIDDFRNFFNPNKKEHEFNIREVFEKTFKLIDAQFKNNNIEIKTNLDNFTIYGLENEFLQVLVNLLKNAKDALIDNRAEDRLIIIEAFKKDKKAYIKIKDNAGGIDEKIKNKIFQAYFTTKDENKGTGIGLYMSKEIIQKHMNGNLTFKNEEFNYNDKECVGAEFIIEVPS